MRNPLNRPMLAILLAAGVVSLLDDEPPTATQKPAQVRYVPVVRGGQTLALKLVRRPLHQSTR
jgi:hypothetical protein